ncbi:MAG: lyase family protein [Thermoplasmata archaeon]
MNYYNRAKKYYLETSNIIDIRFIKNLVIFKKIAAKTNFNLNIIDKNKYEVIENSCDKIIEKSDFPEIVVFQTGSGTGMNMAINDLICDYARNYFRTEIDPNDDVNRSQSSNDVIPSVLRITLYMERMTLLKEIQKLVKELEKFSIRYRYYIKSGRTHLRDALPVSLGLEFLSYHEKIKNDLIKIEDAFEDLKYIPAGGTAVGTGMLSSEKFKEELIKNLNYYFGENFTLLKDPGEKMKFVTDVTFLLNSISIYCSDIIRISQDLRLMFSGPFTGINEIELKNMDIEGSSIMPGKKNPVTLESILLGCTYVRGISKISEDSSIIGEFELSLSFPLQMYISIQALDIAIESTKKLILFLNLILPNKKRMENFALYNPEILALLREKLPYKDVSKIIKESDKMDIKQLFKIYKLRPGKIKEIIFNSIDKFY